MDILGAAQWGLNFKDANGDCQSPINVNSRECTYDYKLSKEPLSFNYHSVCRESVLYNNGKHVIWYPKSIIKPGMQNSHLLLV